MEPAYEASKLIEYLSFFRSNELFQLTFNTRNVSKLKLEITFTVQGILLNHVMEVKIDDCCCSVIQRVLGV